MSINQAFTPPKTPFTPTQSGPHKIMTNGERHVYKFPNGHGASVIRGPWTYGGDKGLWELAVINHNEELNYGTPITSDVKGHLTDQDVADLLTRISELDGAK